VIVVVSRIARPVDTNTFTDLTAVPLTSVYWTPDGSGSLSLDFAGNPTATEIVTIKIRAMTIDAAAEAILRQAYTAYQNNVAYLAIASPTTAQALAQVTTLTRQVNGIISYLAPLT
jgi:hypothetical protein